jgi:hypothetical protein
VLEAGVAPRDVLGVSPHHERVPPPDDERLAVLLERNADMVEQGVSQASSDDSS